MPSLGALGSNKKQIAIKHADGEPLTRSDLQYDLLYYLFSDTRAVFTDPHTTLKGDSPGTKVTFRDLYVNALVHSPRCSKVSRNKLLANPQFADEFAKISLLSNINRINTTMAFFPEMRTTLRTYHPVPSLQKTEGSNLQDAPRIKNLLKFCLLTNEVQNTPVTTADVLKRIRSGIVPPTSIVNLIFIFQSHSSMLAQAHFPSSVTFELQDFFTPINISSESRVRVFLWLCYHYYEGSSPNPFDDTYSALHPGMIPKLYSLSPEEALLENVDTTEEKVWGERMTNQRRLFLLTKNKPLSLTEDLGHITESVPSAPIQKAKGGRGGRGGSRGIGRRMRVTEGRILPLSGPSSSTARSAPIHSRDGSNVCDASPAYSSTEGSADDALHRSESRLSPSPQPQTTRRPSPAITPIALSPSDSRLDTERQPLQPQSHSLATEPYPPWGVNSHSAYMHTESNHGGPIRYNSRAHRASARSTSSNAHTTMDSTERDLQENALHFSHISSLSYRDHNPSQLRCVSPHQPPHPTFPFCESCITPSVFQPRTMLEQAWHVVMTTDPLSESHERDENARLDLLLRLKIINRLRGKEPTPEPDPVRVREAQSMASAVTPAQRERSFIY